MLSSQTFAQFRYFRQPFAPHKHLIEDNGKKRKMGMIIVSPDFLIFDRELVIISDLLPDSYWLLRVDHDLVLPINLDHFGVAVWLQNKVGKLLKN